MLDAKDVYVTNNNLQQLFANIYFDIYLTI